MNYDRRYQSEYNGPLTASVRRRLNRAKNKLNLNLVEVGERLGFSGPFMSQLLRDEDPARMRTKHVERVIAALDRLERDAGLSEATGEPSNPAPSAAAGAPQSLEDLVRAAHDLGFEVSFKPLGR